MKKLVLLLPLLLTACQTSQVITSKEQIVVEVPSSYYNCPTDVYMPDPKKLTDIQVARILVTLHKNNTVCKNSINAIRKFLDEAKQTVETKSAD